MMGNFRHVTGAAVLALSSIGAAAQNVVPVQMTGQPLQYLRDGAVNGCGIRIIAVEVADNLSTEASEVSVNLYDGGRAVVKAIAYAPLARGNQSVKTLKVKSAWARAPGSTATRALGQTSYGDDNRSLLYATELMGALAILQAQVEGKPVQISVQREREERYRVLSGVVPLSLPEQEQLKACISELVEKMQRDLSNIPASAPR